MSVVPIYACMRHRKKSHFLTAAAVAVGICCLAYTGAAAFGYLTFGDKVSVSKTLC